MLFASAQPVSRTRLAARCERASGVRAVDNPNDGNPFGQWLIQAVPFLFACMLSAAGGAVRYLNAVNRSAASFRLSMFFIEIFTSAFTGVVVYELCDYASLSWSATAAIVAISGHMGVRALSTVERMLVSAITEYTKGKNHDDEER